MAGAFETVTHYVFRARPCQCVRPRLHGFDCRKICDFSLTWGASALFYEFRETRTGPMRGAGVLPGSGSSRCWSDWMTRVGFCLVPEEAAIFDSLVADFVGEIR